MQNCVIFGIIQFNSKLIIILTLNQVLTVLLGPFRFCVLVHKTNQNLSTQPQRCVTNNYLDTFTRIQTHTYKISHGCTSSWPPMARDVWLINQAFINTRIGERPPKSTYISARHFYPSFHELDLQRQSMRSAAHTWLHNEMVS